LKAYKDQQTGLWLVERNGLQALDASLVKACAIIFRMETEQ